MSANSIERLNAFAALEAIENLEHFFVPVVRDGRNRHAHRFRCGITEKALGPSVPTCDPTFEIRPDDKAITQLDDGGELPCPLLTVP